MNTFNIVLDLDKSESRTPTVRLRQGDRDGTVIAAAIYDHGAALSGTVTACAIVMKLPDGTHYYRKSAAWADGVATVTIDERQAASVVGRTVLAYFTLTVGTALYSTGSFVVVVKPDAVGDAELPEDYDTAIQDAINRCNAAAAALEGALPIGTDKLADGAVTSNKLAVGAVTRDEISDSLYNELSDISYVSTDATTQSVMANVGKTAVTLAPNAFDSSSGESDNSRTRLCWFTIANGLEVAPISYMADLEGVLTFYARGLRTMASGTMNDTSWTITALPTDVDGVSY